jgi:hypothetical protein
VTDPDAAAHPDVQLIRLPNLAVAVYTHSFLGFGQEAAQAETLALALGTPSLGGNNTDHMDHMDHMEIPMTPSPSAEALKGGLEGHEDVPSGAKTNSQVQCDASLFPGFLFLVNYAPSCLFVFLFSMHNQCQTPGEVPC